MDMLVLEIVTFEGYTAADVANAIRMLPGVAMADRLDESEPKRIRTQVGTAMMTRAEPGELCATVSVRLMREALA